MVLICPQCETRLSKQLLRGFLRSVLYLRPHELSQAIPQLHSFKRLLCLSCELTRSAINWTTQVKFKKGRDYVTPPTKPMAVFLLQTNSVRSFKDTAPWIKAFLRETGWLTGKLEVRYHNMNLILCSAFDLAGEKSSSGKQTSVQRSVAKNTSQGTPCSAEAVAVSSGPTTAITS